jgi:hypothetical protein
MQAAAQTVNAGAKAALTSETWTPPKTPDGHPDIQGVWLSNSATPLERPKELEGKPLLTDAEVAEFKKRAERIFRSGPTDFAGGDNFYLAIVANPEQYHNPNATESAADMIDREIENRTSLIVDPSDGKIPWTPEGLAREEAAVASRQASEASGPWDLPNDFRCLTYGVPRLGGLYGAGNYSYYEIFQAPGYVVLMTEFIHEARLIPIDGRPHLPDDLRQLNGDSRGHWEGDTLVVDTTNFSAQSFFQGSSENLHLVERFTRVALGTIRYEVTLTDPTTWSKPWKAELMLRLQKQEIYEAACHEGNYQVMRGMLAEARGADESKGTTNAQH